MIPLDIAGSGLFNGSVDFMHVLGSALKLLGGSFMIIAITFFSAIATVVYSIRKGIQHASLLHGLRVLLRSVTYLIGISLALVFILVASVFFSISALKLLAIAAVIVFVSAFVARETVLFLIFRRFGRYILYLTTLHRTSKVVYNYVKTEKGNGFQSPEREG